MTWVAVSHKNEKATLLKCFGSRGLCWKFTTYKWKLESFKLHRILCRILHRILNRIIYKILHSFICECIGFLDTNHCQARENSNKRAWRNKGAGWNFYPTVLLRTNETAVKCSWQFCCFDHLLDAGVPQIIYHFKALI